jgi:hypothetical protein
VAFDTLRYAHLALALICIPDIWAAKIPGYETIENEDKNKPDTQAIVKRNNSVLMWSYFSESLQVFAYLGVMLNAQNTLK